MAELVIIIDMGLSKILSDGMIKDIIRMGIGAISGVIIYFGLTMYFKANELKSVLNKE